jgi:hypothetical protein
MVENQKAPPIWLSVSKILGGASYGAVMGALIDPWIEQSLLAVASGAIVGGILGAYIAARFESIQIRLYSALFIILHVRFDEERLGSGFARGLGIVRFVCVFLTIPFGVVCSVALALLFSIAAGILDGPAGGIELFGQMAHGAFWLMGLYVHVALVVAVVSWSLVLICRVVHYRRVERKHLHTSQASIARPGSSA